MLRKKKKKECAKELLLPSMWNVGEDGVWEEALFSLSFMKRRTVLFC